MELQQKIEEVFQELNFDKLILNGDSLMLHNGIYYKVTFVKGLKAYVIEFANNYDEAVNNVFEDGDIYPVSLGENELLSKLRDDLKKYYLNDQILIVTLIGFMPFKVSFLDGEWMSGMDGKSRLIEENESSYLELSIR